ncbi:hypothetical protein [Burkholderia cepacia]|uniref:Uncharacterized protein n=1 Tax=Burkholderia cepacia GG4 TaxID=1009846 RepID=A0A9W3K6S0_BURCE|nr:hypothetical protein [Burkholderia cepacia]AFQ51439.1 hypothetical protein GEM_5052 [Burkholderia cepacia GG4]
MFPNVPPASVDTERLPIALPTVPGTLDVLRVRHAELAGTLSRLPLDRMGIHLNTALASTRALFAQLDTELAPHARDALGAARQTFAAAQATLGQEGASASNVQRALTQFTRTSSALRALADDLEHHPEWLLPGAAGDAQPVDAARRASDGR